jgi:hypothetical protein
MDIDRLARRVSEQLAARPSRRGIVSAVGKLAAGAGVVLGGLRHPSGAGAAEFCQMADTCCTNNCGSPYGDSACGTKCPGDMKKRYQWFCNYNGARHLCIDCYKSGSYTCTAVTTR